MSGRFKSGFFLAVLVGGVLSVASCGGGSSSDDVSGYVGMWQYTSGTSNTQCPMLGVNDTEQLTGQKETFAKGIDAPLIDSEPNTNCTLKFMVAAGTATAIPGQTCMTTLTSNGQADPETISVTSAVFTVTGSTTGHLSLSANLTVNANGTTVSCTYTGSGDLMRISM